MGVHRLRCLASAEGGRGRRQRRGYPEGLLCCLEVRCSGGAAVAHPPLSLLWSPRMSALMYELASALLILTFLLTLEDL